MKKKKTSWGTTIAGVAALLMAAFAIYKDPNKISDPTVVGIIAAGGGLVKAQDDRRE